MKRGSALPIPFLDEMTNPDQPPTSFFSFVNWRMSLINHSSHVASESTFPIAPAVNPAIVVAVDALEATVLVVAGAAVLQEVGPEMLDGSLKKSGVPLPLVPTAYQ